ncbi:S1C family serine protease [Amycolatopsis alkalitolerans]|uniref:Trypsin-like serine protease n=1 Tax=Amycolatopsis alkalitolerans TaxID=2547244 RepID=A0A5C4LZM9_9PSEU|nr:trypsin-like peptidase domain-containing protein [Amycolatopsis alkalitolerans]TNC24617.1 trypsin-like serine protease [Amycolatopsis alkalitolerans]
MSENDFRPGHADGYQPQQQSYPYYYAHQPTPAGPALAPPPRKKKRVAALVSATAVAAALVGGASGAAIVGLEGGSSAGSNSTAAATAVSGTTSTDVSAAAAKVLPSVVQVNVTTSQGEAIGSGVILSADGKILTNAHVVSGAVGNVTITLSDGTKYQVSVLGADTKADIAVLQAKGASGLTAATLGNSSQLQVGQEVVAIGSPAGLQNTVTSGIVSALNRQLSDIGTGGQQSSPFDQTSARSGDSPSYTAIQTDAAINQGNSGGALVNMAGQVIGINSALYSPSSSAGSVGIGFAIPINDAKTIVNQIENG